MINYKILLASPNDVIKERELITKNISELNIILNKFFDINLQLIKWETNVYSAIGDNSQEVINEQVGSDYKIFLGIMWKRFGTKTRNAGSGTEEEFDKAYKRYSKDKSSIQIMFYFSSVSPESLEDINPQQYKLVNDFKKKIQDLGVLTV